MSQTELSRRQFLKKSFSKWLGLSLLGISGIYSYSLEPKWIEIKEQWLFLPSLPPSFQHTRIVHFSDLHLGFYLDPSDLSSLVQHIQQLKPDLLCFTGDLIDKDPNVISAAIPYLSQLQAPLGKYAVLGNHDYRGNAQMVQQGLAQSGFHVLVNSHQLVQKGNDRIAIAGVDDQLTGHPNLVQALHGLDSHTCTILLSHCPDFADQARKKPVALQLSGHSHGGQIRLPLIGHIVTPPYGRKYVQGFHQVEGSSLKVYVNRGIGTTILPLRFFCRPEITVLVLTSKKSR
ncbi:metallophosphoesterase [Thermoflavimicrobium dichotomicum]|uniref:Calcineurin-like phosphoesterase domain-containing protein n=1 Tax=Thermoflavimicrobium dichotomicum TaxID=46223 RepID=A0A1I3TQ67_9BACL|nr:metallophosphoesterase [Thermoflavimicrobium dichotomicum]SFJ73368.1 hypothetical protein SAMN05421852_11942 [Thermoflavimicrobium dichotomicum]